MRELRNYPRRGSHLPVLMKLIPMTTGSVLELGAGVYSTIYLHWACYPGRKLLTYEDNPRFYDFVRRFEKPYHEIRCIANWDEVQYGDKWSVAFIDHGQDERRWIEISRLTDAEYVVAHDAEESSTEKYKYPSIFHLFKYRYIYKGANPNTIVLSNFHDVSNLKI